MSTWIQRQATLTDCSDGGLQDVTYPDNEEGSRIATMNGNRGEREVRHDTMIREFSTFDDTQFNTRVPYVAHGTLARIEKSLTTIDVILTLE